MTKLERMTALDTERGVDIRLSLEAGRGLWTDVLILRTT